jgi:hypothetical protein
MSENFSLQTPSAALALLQDPFSNKGTRFTFAERVEHGLVGLIAPAVRTRSQQIQVVKNALRRRDGADPLCKYELLISLLNDDVDLFFALVCICSFVAYLYCARMHSQPHSSIYRLTIPRGTDAGPREY